MTANQQTIKRNYTMNDTHKKQYNKFEAIDGTKFSFDNYMDFATWFFNISRRVLEVAFDKETFRRLQYEAANSREARTRI